MNAYLSSTGHPVVTAEDVRKAIGLVATGYDPLIEAGIRTLMTVGGLAAARTTWMVLESDWQKGPETHRYGNLVDIGETTEWNGQTYRYLTFAPKDRDVRELTARAVRKALRTREIADALADQQRAAREAA